MFSRLASGSVLAAVATLFFSPALPANAQAVTKPLAKVVDITVNSITPQSGSLIANATVTLDVVGKTITRTTSFPIALGSTAGTAGECDILNLALGPIYLNVLGLNVELDDCDDGPVTVDILAQQGSGDLLGNLLCEIAGLLDGGLDVGDVLDGLTPAESATVLNGLTNVLNGVLDGLLAQGTQTVGVHSKAQVDNGSCDILQLEVPEGLNLNLLGLVVDTSPICLDVYAVRGSNNLLGNLLCSLTGLLDNRSNDAARQAHVRNIVRLLSRI